MSFTKRCGKWVPFPSRPSAARPGMTLLCHPWRGSRERAPGTGPTHASFTKAMWKMGSLPSRPSAARPGRTRCHPRRGSRERAEGRGPTRELHQSDVENGFPSPHGLRPLGREGHSSVTPGEARVSETREGGPPARASPKRCEKWVPFPSRPSAARPGRTLLCHPRRGSRERASGRGPTRASFTKTMWKMGSLPLPAFGRSAGNDTDTMITGSWRRAHSTADSRSRSA